MLKIRSYVLAMIERGQIAEVVKAVREQNEVVEGALLIGRYDMLARVEHYDLADLYSCISKIRAIPGIKGTSTHTPFEGFKKEHMIEENDAVAISLLRTEVPPGNVLPQLRSFEHIVEAHIIPGEWDLIATLHGKKFEQVIETAVTGFETMQGIAKTETLIANQFFRKTPETTVTVGTFVPQLALENFKQRLTTSQTTTV